MAGDVWLDHRQAISCRGNRFDTEWTGTEHVAFGPVAYNRDVARILATPDDVAAEAFERAVQIGIDQAQAGAVIEHGPPCDTCGKPSARTIGGKQYCSEHGEPLPIPEAVLKRIAATAPTAGDEDEIKRARAESGLHILLEQLDRDYEPESAARDRLLRQFGGLRDDVFAGKVRVGARWPGQKDVRPVVLDELRTRYPGDPHETRIELPSLALPMTLVFSEADILALKGPRAGQRRSSSRPRPLGKGKAAGLARQFLDGRNGQPTTQADLWAELRRHGHCPRSVMREAAKACGLTGRGRPGKEIGRRK